MDPKIEMALARGFNYAGQAVATASWNEKCKFIQLAKDELDPISTPDHKVPRAAMALGVLGHNTAMYLLNHADLTEDERLQNAYICFANAAKYFDIAAGMEDFESDLSPARAMNELANLYALGVLGDGTKKTEHAFDWRLKAAKQGLAAAQLDVAVMFYRGEGTEKSLEQAYQWMSLAEQNKNQFAPENQPAVSRFLVQIEAEYKETLSPLFPAKKKDMPLAPTSGSKSPT